ncbi:MAG: hypothetical protein ACRDQF_21920, partial [Thermocrispum sp.]
AVLVGRYAVFEPGALTGGPVDMDALAKAIGVSVWLTMTLPGSAGCWRNGATGGRGHRVADHRCQDARHIRTVIVP